MYKVDLQASIATLGQMLNVILLGIGLISIKELPSGHGLSSATLQREREPKPEIVCVMEESRVIFLVCFWVFY